MLTSIWAKLHKSSVCEKMLVALRIPGDHALKANRSMIDPSMELKVDCPGIQEYWHIS
jgi:hypothetical protein